MKLIRLLLCGMLVLLFGCHCSERQAGVDVAPSALVQGGGIPQAPARGTVDVASRPVLRIAPGTVIGDGPPPGWSNLVVIANPSLGAGDVNDVPRTALEYARMFKFTVLANVKKKADGRSYGLDVVGRGFAVSIRGKDTIIDTAHTLGADLGLFGKRVLDENEKILDKDLRQVARTDTMMIFDAQAIVLWKNDHRKMVVRHAILVLPETGQLATLVWLVGKDQAGAYALAENALQLLPPNMHEERLLSVKKDRFFLGIPSPDAFALVRIPQGKALAWTPESGRLAAIKEFTPDQALALEAQLRAGVRQAIVR